MSQDQTTPQDHVVRAKQIADALDSQDMERTLHEQFYAEWKAWEAEDPTRTMAAFDRAVGRHRGYTGNIVQVVTAGTSVLRSTETARRSNARKILRDEPQAVAPEIAKAMENPEVREQVAKHMTSKAADDLSDKAHDHHAPDLSHLREQRRQREEQDRTQETSLKWLEAGAHLSQAERRIMRALEVIRYVEWTDEAVDGLEDYVEGIDEAMALVKAALRGDTGTDWDAELDKLLAAERDNG